MPEYISQDIWIPDGYVKFHINWKDDKQFRIVPAIVDVGFKKIKKERDDNG